jgi:hypothetical protein
MKMTKEIEEFLNLAITEHMGKAYTDWKLDKEWKMLKKSPEKQSGGIESGNKSGKYFQENQKVKAVSNADRIDRRKKKGMKTQRTGSGAHGGSESQYRRTGEQRQQRRRRRRQEAREGGKDTQEEQSGQTRQGAEAGQRET